MAKKNSTKTATKEALQASEPHVQTFSQWGGMYIKESPYGWTTDYEFERHGHIQNQTDLKPNFLMIQDNVITTSNKSLETRNETQLVSTAPHGLSFTGVTCLAGNVLYAAFNDGSIRRLDLDFAPNTEPNDISQSKWIPVNIFDADNPSGSLSSHVWQSINVFEGQLIAFAKTDSESSGEIFSGDLDASISSAVYIFDPRGESLTPYTKGYGWLTFPPDFSKFNPQTVSEKSKYEYKESNLYIRDTNQLILTTLDRSGYGQSNIQIVVDALYGTFSWRNGVRVFNYKGESYTADEAVDAFNTTQAGDAYFDIESETVWHTENHEFVQNSATYTFITLPHRLQFCYTYSNKFGQTLESAWQTVYTNLSPQVWTSDTGGITLSQIISDPQDYPDLDPLITDFGITGVDIYYCKDDALDMVFCGHVSQQEPNMDNIGPDRYINTMMPGTIWRYTWYGAYADISEWTNVSLTVPTENTTKGVDAAYMNVHDGRCYFFGGSLPYRLWIGGRVGNELCIATGVGGGYVDIEPGSGMVINNTHKFKTYNGANIVTIMCGHPNTHQVRRFNLVQTNVTLTNELSAAGFMTEEVSNVVGTLSHHGSGVWAQGLYTLSRYGLALTTQQMENTNNLRAQLVSDAIQPFFTESLASALNNTQMIFIDDVIYFALAKGEQYLNCGLIGHEYSNNFQYFTRNEYDLLTRLDINDAVKGRAMNNIMGFNSLPFENTPDYLVKDWDYPQAVAQDSEIISYFEPCRPGRKTYANMYIALEYTHKTDSSQTGNPVTEIVGLTDDALDGEIQAYIGVDDIVDLYSNSSARELVRQTIVEHPERFLPCLYARKDPALSFMDDSDWLISYTVKRFAFSNIRYNQQEFIPPYDAVSRIINDDLIYDWYLRSIDVQTMLPVYTSAAETTFDPDTNYYYIQNRSEQFSPASIDPDHPEVYYNNIYKYYIKEAILDDIIFAFDVNSQAWYTFTYQPNLISDTIEHFGPDTPQNTTTDPEQYSSAIKSLINFDSQASPEGIGIVTSDRIDMIPTAGVIDNAPTYSSTGDIEVPNYVATIETGELSTSSPPQQFHTLSQLEFRFDYFFGDVDIDIEGVDYYGRPFHVHKDVTYDTIQQDLAVYVRVDYIVNTYNIKIKGRAHFRLTHVLAKVYPESKKINLVYGFNDADYYKKRHGGTEFKHHYIKDYNNLRRALEP